MSQLHIDISVKLTCSLQGRRLFRMASKGCTEAPGDKEKIYYLRTYEGTFYYVPKEGKSYSIVYE